MGSAMLPCFVTRSCAAPIWRQKRPVGIPVAGASSRAESGSLTPTPSQAVTMFNGFDAAYSQSKPIAGRALAHLVQGQLIKPHRA